MVFLSKQLFSRLDSIEGKFSTMIILINFKRQYSHESNNKNKYYKKNSKFVSYSERKLSNLQLFCNSNNFSTAIELTRYQTILLSIAEKSTLTSASALLLEIGKVKEG